MGRRGRDWRGAALTRILLTKRHSLYAGFGRNGLKSRRLPGITQRLAALLAYRAETLGQTITLGDSQEPPVYPEVFRWLRRLSAATGDRARSRQVSGYASKRLPWRRPDPRLSELLVSQLITDLLITAYFLLTTLVICEDALCG